MLSFGQRLKMLRREADLSQSDLAEALGASVQSVSKWECDSNMPDISMLLPLSSVLGVTTDCLLGAGTNEKEDTVRLEEEIEEIYASPSSDSNHGNCYYRTFKAIEMFLKKYPLSYDYKLKCADYIYIYLLGKSRDQYEIPDYEFEELWNKGFKMVTAVKNQDKDPTRFGIACLQMIYYYCLKGEYDKAETVAGELPVSIAPKINALWTIADQKRDFERAEKLATFAAISHYNDCCWYMWSRARRISIFGQVRKEEAIEAWHDALITTREYDRLFGKDWPYGDTEGLFEVENHPKIIESNIYFGLIGDLLAIGRISEALDLVEELTEVGISLHQELKEKLKSGKIDEKTYAENLSMIKDFPLHSYNSVIQDDDNILTREKRFKECRSKLNALE